MSLTAVIIDDEQHARENLNMLLQEYCPEVTVLGFGQDIATGKAAIELHTPDVIFLDIRMPSGSEGFELLQQVELDDTMVVFVTAFKDYAVDAFKVNAIDYLLKPIDIDDMERTVAKVMQLKTDSSRGDKEHYRERLQDTSEQLRASPKRLSIAHAHGVKLVRIEDLAYLAAEGNCTRIHFKDGTQYLDTRTLKIYEAELAEADYYRVHRSYLVALSEIDELLRVDGTQVRLRSGTVLPVSRSAIKGLLDRL